MAELLNGRCAFRVNSEMLETFETKCTGLSREYQHVLRELISAFNDDRLQINTTDEQKETLRNLYNVN
jgi:hypothetical protein